ncbi:hypothetical protein B0A55_02072 [Friedmanniomyces simplex]|uniref:Uncharacterized protein n=1 Tax=Friedmanniomyces simplex TaxID=329884 RepID=A0A4U0XXH8_9PEZI|nr:hypothetical protein B0A55_02072 [Friedmanniomyces simplex]
MPPRAKKKRATDSPKQPPGLAEWQPPPAKRSNSLMTLPAELRNHVYEDVLVDSRPIRMFRDNGGRDRSQSTKRKRTPWREPELLAVSKAIRAETSTIYYRGNDFDIEVYLPDIADLCRRIRRLVERYGIRPFRSLRIVIPDADWSELRYGRLLGLLFYQTGLQAGPGVGTGAARAGFKETQVLCTKYVKIEAALRAVIEIGRKSAREGWDQWRMEVEIDRWLEMCLANKDKSSASKAWKSVVKV